MYNYTRMTLNGNLASDQIRNSKLAIQEANEVVNRLEAESKHYEYLLNLAINNRIKVIKDNIRYAIPEKVIQDALTYLKDKTQNKELKDYYKFVNTYVSEVLGIESKVKVDKIMIYGYGGYAYQLEFDYEGGRYGLIIPMIDKLSKEYYQSVSEGRMSIATLTENCISTFASSYDEDEIKTAFQNEINKKESK